MLSPFPSRVMWVYALAAGSIMILALIWYVFHFIFWFVQPAMVDIAVELETNETQFYQVDSFFQVIDNYALIIALIALFIFMVVYSQRRGIEV